MKMLLQGLDAGLCMKSPGHRLVATAAPLTNVSRRLVYQAKGRLLARRNSHRKIRCWSLYDLFHA
jgi:hypothetical protein